MTRVLHLLGPTGAGKSTIITKMREMAGDRIHTVEIGKMMRAKYPPEYFAGQGNPKHTAAEAWQTYLDHVRYGMEAGKRLIVVDGQPRDVQQTRDILKAFGEDWSGWPVSSRASFVLITCPHEERERRAKELHASNPAALQLSLQRLVNDYRSCYDVLAVLLGAKWDLTSKESGNPILTLALRVRVVDTSFHSPEEAAKLLLATYEGDL